MVVQPYKPIELSLLGHTDGGAGEGLRSSEPPGGLPLTLLWCKSLGAISIVNLSFTFLRRTSDRGRLGGPPQPRFSSEDGASDGRSVDAVAFEPPRPLGPT